MNTQKRVSPLYKNFVDETPRMHGVNVWTGCLSAVCESCGRKATGSASKLAKTGNPGECCGQIMTIVEEN